MARISTGPAASAKPIAVPRNGAEQGVASKGGKGAGRDAAEQSLAVGAAGETAQRLRQRHFEEAPEIGGEQREQRRHGGEEQRLLELNAPADRNPGRREPDRGQRQRQEGEQNAACGGEEAAPHRALASARHG